MRQPLIAFCAAVAFVAMPARIPTAAAQRLSTSRDAITFETFDKRGGLLPATVFSMTRDRTGLLWVGTEEGAAYFTGHAWKRVTLPATYRWNAVRVILPTADGSLWFATRDGVICTHGSDTTRFVATPDGLADDNIYDLREVTIFGGRQILAASRGSLARFDGTRFVRVPLPAGLEPHGMVTLETVGADGVPTLWVATPNVGLWRLHAGVWESISAPMGLTTSKVEAIIPARAAGRGGPLLYVAGQGGVFALEDGRFQLIPGTPEDAFRVLEVERASGERELWVGSARGELTRRTANGIWEELRPPTGLARSSIMSLTATTRPGEEPVVWVGYRSERLTRIMLTRARYMPMPPALADPLVTTVRTVLFGAEQEYWIGTRNPGVLRITSRGSFLDATSPSLGLGHVTSITRLGDTVWATGDQGVATWSAQQGWRSASTGLGGTELVRFSRVENADGTQVLYGGGKNGLWRWTGGEWIRLDIPLVGGITDMVQVDDPGGEPVLWVAASGGQIWRVRGRDATPTVSNRGVTGRADVFDLVLQKQSDGSRRLWAATSGLGGLRYRDIDRPDAEWQTLNAELQDAMPSDFVRDLELGSGDRLYAATPRGIAQLRIVSPDSMFLETVYGADEGLPSSDVYKIEYEPSTGELLVGTRTGLAWLRPIVPLDADDPPLRVVASIGDRRIASGARLPYDDASLAFDFALLNYFRESETRYRTRLTGGSGALSDWSADNSIALGALKPGSYRLEVWARDYRGQVVGPEAFLFVVAPPWWWSPLARLGYLLLAILGIWSLVRWRTRAASDRAQRYERRERIAAAGERRFRALFDRAFDAHLLLADDRITSANQAAASLFGVEDETALTGRMFTTLVPGGPVEAGGSYAAEVRRHDGVAVPVQIATTEIPLDDTPGALVHVVLRDLSDEHRAEAERARLEEQVRQSQKIESLGTLAGGIAHDFNNLLTVIRSSTELMLEHHPGESEDHRALEMIRQAADRARELVRQILTFSRRSPLAHTTVALSPLLRDLESLVRSTAPSTMAVDVSLCAEPLAVLGDVTQLQQMLLNFCVNAEHAMRGHGGTLTIALDRVDTDAIGRLGHEGLQPGAYAVITVRDTGVGISADALPRIFEPFFTTKTVGEGTGLGLSVSHGIVLSHRGSVAVSSLPGSGTTVEVLLPLAEYREVEAPTPTPRLKASRIGTRLLVVDDDPAVRSVTERLLVRLGYGVTVCASGAEALGWLRATPDGFDLMLTDQTMPGMTGDRLVVEARLIRQDLPIIMMTGFSHLLTPELIAGLGVAAVLYKPMDRNELVSAIEEATRVT